MNTDIHDFDVIKGDLLQVNTEILALFEKARTIPGMSKFPFDGWEKVGHSIEEQIHDDILRVAVVGAIKSGKSTFVNSLLGGDYLKRGAGVVTSIVTRIRKSSQLTASLDFKTWDDVNTDMQQAMILFPSLNWRPDGGGFDIRREEDRRELGKALDSVSVEKLISKETLDVNGVLLTSYLKGYGRVREMIGRSSELQKFEKSNFSRHKDFVGDDSLAVYLKDLELGIPGGEILGENIEIADCQGIDSLNPLHLAMIQDYLLRAHLIIYILSSRTGIRQADMRFLSIIRKMGLMENIFFVVNCDFNEHEDIDGLKAVVARIREEISVVKPGPKLFTFSTLFHLLDGLDDTITRRDRVRMEQWQNEKEFSDFSHSERARFLSTFFEKLTRDRFTLLLKNHVERVGIIAAGLHDWTEINNDILRKNTEGAKEVLTRIETAREKLNQQKSLIKNTLDGTSQKAKRELGRDVDRFLDVRYGDLAKDINGFVKKYTVDYSKNESDIEEMGFSTTLYMIFQDFKRALDRYMAETINPRLIEFIKKEEGKFRDLLDTTVNSYDALVRDVLQKHEETLKGLGISSRSYRAAEMHSVDMEGLKRRNALSAPPLVSTFRYTAKIRTEAIMRRGFYNVVKVLKKLMKKPIQNEQEGEIFALKDGVKRIKQETENSIAFHLKDYKENLKFQYLYKLVDSVSENLLETLLDRFNVFTTDMSEMAGLVDAEQSAKEKAVEILKSMEAGSREVLEDISRLRGEFES
ncbi:MAG: dynamin family protein [Deltaproteobacteria bacterium]|nr:dynamin family protein [Deltaproteobacteria bacterium]MBN2846617.1 dynamin family protein [Deltaproteobacteria bacterium]